MIRPEGVLGVERAEDTDGAACAEEEEGEEKPKAAPDMTSRARFASASGVRSCGCCANAAVDALLVLKPAPTLSRCLGVLGAEEAGEDIELAERTLLMPALSC